MAVNDAFSCGFVKVAVYNIFSKDIPRIKGESNKSYKQRTTTQYFETYNTFFDTENDARF